MEKHKWPVRFIDYKETVFRGEALKTFLKPLTAEEERYFLKRCQDGDILARHILIERNLRLVAHVVKKYQNTDEEQGDLISVGTIGLIKAIATFDTEKSTRLSTYAARCIDNAILSQMRLWWRTNLPRAEKNSNGVFWHKFPRIYTSFVPLQTAM